METIRSADHNIATNENIRRQLILSPVEWGGKYWDRLILLCTTPHNINLTPEEDIRLDIEKFPAIGVVKTDGSVHVDVTRCLDSVFYDDPEKLLNDLNLLLMINGISKIKTEK